jgi:cytochrome c
VRYLRLITALAMLCVAYPGIGSASAEDYGTKDPAVAMVKPAIARVNDVGFDTARVEFMDRKGKFFDRDMCIIVVDMAGTRVVHGQNPKLVGMTFG